MSKDAKRQKLQRRRERDFREKKISRTYEQPKPPKSNHKTVILQSYQITSEAISDQKDPMMTLRGLLGGDAMEELFYQCKDEPSVAIPRLLQLIENHPNVPSLYNWLAVAYGRTGDNGKAGEINRLNYERNPEYLFALVNHCVPLLDGGQVQRVTEILNGRYDLQQLYPHRNVFHISEALGFYYMMVMYYVKLGKPKPAESLARVMEQLDPDCDQTLAARAMLASKLRFSFFGNTFGQRGNYPNELRYALPGFSAGK